MKKSIKLFSSLAIIATLSFPFYSPAVSHANDVEVALFEKNSIGTNTLIELQPSDEITPLNSDYHFEKIEVGGLGITSIGSTQANSFARSVGYKDAHALKYDILGKNAPISNYNLYYAKSNRNYVYILNGINRGVMTPFQYNPMSPYQHLSDY